MIVLINFRSISAFIPLLQPLSAGSVGSLGSLLVDEVSFRRTPESSKTDDFFFPP